MRRIAFAAAVMTLGFASIAEAAPVSFSQTQILTSNGQDFTYNFNGAPASDGTGGILTIASGVSLTFAPLYNGLDLDQNGEFFDVSVEGTGLGRYACNSGSGATNIPGNTGGIDCDFSLDIPLTGTQLDAFLLDGLVSVGINFSRFVNHLGDQDQVIVTISYQGADVEFGVVPLPAAGVMLMTGIGALGWMRRKA